MQTNKIATEITRLSLSRKVTVFVLFLTILAVGMIAVSQVAFGKKYPRGQDYNYIRIGPGGVLGVAEEAMQKIGLPMEEELSTVRGISSIDTRFADSAEVSLRFKRGTDMDVAYREVRDRMERASLRFPEGWTIIASTKYGGLSQTVCRHVHPIQRRR